MTTMAEKIDKIEPTWPPVEQGQRTLYEILFYSQGPVDGYILGDGVRDLLLKSGLPLIVLSQIWNLADVSNDNVLDVHEFVLVMHLIRGVMQGMTLPKTLPPDLTPPKTSPVAPPPMSQQDKEAYTKVFQSFHGASTGFIDGTVAADIFRSSQLPDDVLIQIWDLADFGRDGKLSLEEFTVACHLLRHVKQGGQLNGPIDIFQYAPQFIAQQSLMARKRRQQQLAENRQQLSWALEKMISCRIAEYENHKQRLMSLKERRKAQSEKESRRLNLAKAKVKLFQELFDLLTSLNKGAEAEITSLQQTITKEKSDLEKQEEIVDRLKKEHEKVRQETVKIILGEQKLNNDVTVIKRDTDELNKRLQAVHTHATKDQDPFHRLYEQRREKRQGSTIKDLDKIHVDVPFGFSPFDNSVTSASLPSGAQVFAKGNNSVSNRENNKPILASLKEFGEEFMETWSRTTALTTEITNTCDEDEIFQNVYDWSEDNWPDLDWSADGLLGLTSDQVVQLKIKLADLREAVQKLNSDGGRLVFKNPDDYTARRRAREEEERTEKARVPRRSINERLRTGSSGTGRQRDASNRYSYSGERSLSLDTPEVARAVREYRLNRRSQILENSETSTENHKIEIQSEPSSTAASPRSNIDTVGKSSSPFAETVVSNPDTSTLTLKTSRRKDQLSLELASIALGRQIQIEAIPKPVSSERSQKLNATYEEVHRRKLLSRSKSEDTHLISSTAVVTPTDSLSPSSPDPPPRSSKKFRAPHPPVSDIKAVGADSVPAGAIISVQAKHPTVAESSDRITAQEIHPQRTDTEETRSPQDDESDVKRADNTSSGVPQRPPRLKKRSPQVSVELGSPDPTSVQNGYCLSNKVPKLESAQPSHPESNRDVEQYITTNGVDTEQTLTSNSVSHLESQAVSIDNIDECSVVHDTKKQKEAVIETLHIISQGPPLAINSESQPTSELYNHEQFPLSPELDLSNSFGLVKPNETMVKVSQTVVDVKTSGTNRPPEDNDDVPPPLPSSPPPLPTSAPPLIPSSAYVQKDDPFSSPDTVEEETVVTVEYTIPISLTPEQRRDLAGHNSGLTQSRQGQDLLDFDPLFTPASASEDIIKVNGILHTPIATANMNQSSTLLIDFDDGEAAVRNDDVKSSSDNRFDYVNSENVTDNKRNKPGTIVPGGNVQSTSSSSSTYTKSVKTHDIISVARQEDVIKPSISPVQHTSRPKTLTSGDNEINTVHLNGVALIPYKPSVSPGDKNASRDTGHSRHSKDSRNSTGVPTTREGSMSPRAEGSMSPRAEGAMSPRGKELVDKAKHFADMVQPKVVVRREKEANIEGDFSQDTLQSLELQRRAIISQSTVKRKVNAALSPSDDLESKMFQDSIQTQNKGAKSANPSDYGYTYIEERPAPPPEVGWTEKQSDQVNLYSENVIKEGETTDQVDRESIADLSSTKKQWETVFKSQGPAQGDTSTLKKKNTPKWEVRLPYKEKPSAPSDQSSAHQETEVESSMTSARSAADTESAIEREIRLAHEREEILKREKELRLKAAAAQEKPKSQGQTIIASFEAVSAESESCQPAYNELTEADRGPDIWGVGANGRHNIEEVEDEEADQEKPAVNPNESIIEREIRLQREREEEIARMRQRQGSVGNTKPQAAPAQVKVQQVTHEQVADVNHNHKDNSSYEESQPQDTESLIAKELRELREREEEIRRIHNLFQKTHVTDEHDGQTSNQKPSSLGLAKTSQSNHSSPSPGQGTWQKDVSPFLTANRRESQDSNSSHSTGRTPSESTPSRNVRVQPLADENRDDDDKPNYFKKQETPIEREMRLARERENELRRQKGLPELRPDQDDYYSSYSPGSENNVGNSSSRPRSFAQPSDSMKKFASNRLQQELNQQKERELALRSEGKIISTSEEHIEPLKYMEVAGVDKVDGKEKRNFVTKRSSVVYTEPEVIIVTQTDSPLPAGQPGKKTGAAAGGQLFSYKEFKQTAESKIERELREMREREEELRKQRKEMTGESPR